KVGVEDAADRTWVFINMRDRHRLSAEIENKIREEAKSATPAFKLFETSFKYKAGFQQATDRRHQVMVRTLSVWRQMFKRKQVSLFVPLWKPVLDDVSSATDELSRIVIGKGALNERDRTSARYSQPGGEEARV